MCSIAPNTIYYHGRQRFSASTAMMIMPSQLVFRAFLRPDSAGRIRPKPFQMQERPPSAIFSASWAAFSSPYGAHRQCRASIAGRAFGIELSDSARARHFSRSREISRETGHASASTSELAPPHALPPSPPATTFLDGHRVEPAHLRCQEAAPREREVLITIVKRQDGVSR